MDSKKGENSNSMTENVSAEQKLSKRALKRLLAREKETKRKEAKRSKHEKTSMTNNSDVLKNIGMKETEYYFETGLRKVYPYYYEYASYTKGRWLGRTLLDVFTSEFKYTSTPVVESVENGLVTVNGKKTTTDYKLKDCDYIRNTVHRHELPVVDDTVEIIEDTDQVLVVNKPSSIPIHPCGRYHYNSLTYILAHETGYRNLRSIYRLDRLTSGLMIFCKVEGLARTMSNHIKDRKVQKEYICRVVGRFPDGVIACEEPLEVFSPKVGLQKVSKDGKSAHTTFERMSYNGRSSVVKCMPHTGRTHQIRVHLQFLGYPIINDPLYNHDAWGPNKGKGGEFGKSDEQLLEDLLKIHADGMYVIEPDKEDTTVSKSDKKLNETESNKTASLPEKLNKCQSSDTDLTKCDSTAQATSKCDTSETKYGNCETMRREQSKCECNGQELTTCEASENEHTKCEVNEEPNKCKFSAEKIVQTDSLLKEKAEIDECDTKIEDITLCKKRNNSCEKEFESEIPCKIQKCEDKFESVKEVVKSSEESVSSVDTTRFSQEPSSSVEKRPSFEPSKMTFDQMCMTCQQKFRDPHPQELVMFLHAYSYQGPGWKYTTSLPKWAEEDWTEI